MASSFHRLTKNFTVNKHLLSATLIFVLFVLPGSTLPLFAQVSVAQNTGPSYSGFLRAKGKVITDGDGKTFILRGMGLGGWMLQEGYMFRLGKIGQQHRIKQKIEELVGPEKTARFYKDWLKNHTTRRDIDSMAAWGFNSVRLPMHYNLYTLPVEAEPVAGQNTWLPEGFALTDSLLAWCKANKMYLILDLHATPGGQGNDLNISDRDPAKPSLWQSEADQQKVIALWRKLAERYANEPAIGGYDIINEPNWGFEDPKDIRGTGEKSNKPLRKLMMQITSAIREVDHRHIIIIEGNGFGNNYNGILPTWDDNMVLSFHKYGNFNTQASIQKFLDWQDQYNVPLWLGESGENSNTWFTEAIGLVESRNIGWCWWQLKKMGVNNPLEIKITPSYQKLLDYWVDKGPKPSTGEAQFALDELLENIRIANNIYHKDVTDAMFRQVASVQTIPFREHIIRNGAVVRAVDYDLGRVGYAYWDRDTARYQYVSPPVASAGNRGWSYRNDGVDIQSQPAPNSSAPNTGSQQVSLQSANPNASSRPASPPKDPADYYIFNIEEGEWLQYTVTVADAGAYTLGVRVAAPEKGGLFTLLCNDQPLARSVPVPNTGGLVNWQTIRLPGIRLPKGGNRLKILVENGGFNFKDLQFSK